MKIGFIGAGNMSGAILSGIAASGITDMTSIGVSDADRGKSEALCQRYGFCRYYTNVELAAASDVVFLCVKPNNAAAVLSEIAPCISGKSVVSIVAAWTFAKLKAALPAETRVLRVMPNTPLLVSCGMVAFEQPCDLDRDTYAFVKGIFEAMGEVVEMPSELMDAVTGVSGCGPAFAYLFIDALAKAGERYGLSKKDALTLAAQTAKGSAEMLLRTGRTPEDLTDMVCSPGGATIEGVNVMRASDMDEIMEQTVDAAIRRTREL